MAGIKPTTVVLAVGAVTVVGVIAYLAYRALAQPSPECYPEGAERTQTCPDNSVIVTDVCAGGVWEPTGAICPELPPTPECSPDGAERTLTCPDYSIVVTDVCVGGAWKPTGATCPELPSTGLLRVTTSPAIGVMLLANTDPDPTVAGQVVASSFWGIDWTPLAPGIYYLDVICCDPDWSNYYVQRWLFEIKAGLTTELVVDTTTWTVSAV